MKRFQFAVIGVLFTSVANAQDPITVAGPTPAFTGISGTTIGGFSPAPVGNVMMAAPGRVSTSRTGLFGRLRGRNSGSAMMSAPAMMAAPLSVPFTTGGVPNVGTGTIIITPGSGVALPPVTGPVIGGTITPGTIIPNPMPTPGKGVPIPVPMPPITKPVGMNVPMAMPVVTGTPITVVSGIVTPGTVMTTGGTTTLGTVVQAGGVMTTLGNFTAVTTPSSAMSAPAMMPVSVMNTNASTERMGFFARMRARR